MTFQESQEWEDDSQWREQLRRASLRHTRSLETLDEGRPRRPGDGGSNENRPPARLSVPNHQPSMEDHSSQRLQQHKLDEYTVDYREGRVGPNHYRGHGSQHSETLERTRRGLTCLEGYEWDEAEERFRKPNPPSRIQSPTHQQNHNVQHQPFLADGLPPSPETEREEQRQWQESPAPPPAPGLASPRPQEHPSSAGGDESPAGSSGVGGRPADVSEARPDSAASTAVSPTPQEATPTPTPTSSASLTAPDVIPTLGKYRSQVMRYLRDSKSGYLWSVFK